LSLTPDSDKHSTFSTTFPIYINEKQTSQKALEADPEAEVDEDAEEQFETVTEDNWVRVNDKAPIWMRYVGPAVILQALTSS
jgi:heat shock protein beta